MKGISLQNKEYPSVYTYKNQYLSTLTECLKINETLRLGDIGTLTFEYPIYQVDIYNNLQYDSKGNPLINQKAQHIINDNRILFNGNWYIIKIDENNRDDSNKLTISCQCHGIAYNLQELTVQSLRIIPPLELPVNATSALNSTLMSAQSERTNKIVSASGTTVTLDSNAHPTNGVYNKYKIYLSKGTGVGQTREITAYNGSNKQITVETAFSPQPDTSTTYIIWNPIWSVGTVDSAFNSALRSHEFDFVNGWEAIQQVRDKYLDSNDEVGYLTFTSNWNQTYQRWDNKVNLVKSNPYNSINFVYRKNIKSVTRRQDSSNLYTRIIPQGVDNLTIGSIATENRVDSGITYPTHIYGYNYIDNFKYFLAQGYTYKECRDNFSKVYRFEDARYTDSLSLYNDCKKILEKSSMPIYTYIMSALDLSKLSDGSRTWEEFKIGDTIKVIDEDLGINIFATISNIDRDWDAPQNASVELTNYVDNMSDLLKKIINRNDKYSSLVSNYGNTATYIIADKLTSKNWRQATYVVNENEDAGDVINKIIQSIDETKGGKVVLLDGTYNCRSSINLKSNVAIEGQGTSTKLVGNSSIVAIFASGTVGNLKSNISIRNMYLETFQDIIVMDYCNNVVVKGCLLKNTTGNFIIIQNSININVSDNTIGDINTMQGQDGVDIKASSNVVVNNNTVYSVQFRGINIESSTGETVISNNYMIHNVGDAFDLGCIFIGAVFTTPPSGWQNVTQLYNINVLNNTIVLNNEKPCIDIWGQRNVIINGNKLIGGNGGINMHDTLDCKIFGNNITSTTGANYSAIGINRIRGSYVGRSEIQGNTIYSPTGSFGINFESSPPVIISDMFITNNDLKYSCTSPSSNGLFLNGQTVTTNAGNRLT